MCETIDLRIAKMPTGARSRDDPGPVYTWVPGIPVSHDLSRPPCRTKNEGPSWQDNRSGQRGPFPRASEHQPAQDLPNKMGQGASKHTAVNRVTVAVCQAMCATTMQRHPGHPATSRIPRKQLDQQEDTPDNPPTSAMWGRCPSNLGPDPSSQWKGSTINL